MFRRSALYVEDIQNILGATDNLAVIANSKVLITGATGLIGTVIVDAIMYANNLYNLNTTVVVTSRSIENIQKRFGGYLESDKCEVLIGDISDTSFVDLCVPVDYIIHLASNTHPRLYSTHPIETIRTIVSGTENILEIAAKYNTKRIVYASSVEVYGENKGDLERFSEEDLGYINSNTLRAGYAESKRLSEALAQAYISEKNIDAVSMRLGRVYGATFLDSDTKSTTQFIKNTLLKQDIVLKSKGEQEYSHIYVTDMAVATFFLLANGERGDAYNISHDEVIMLKDVAGVLAGISGAKVVYEIDDVNAGGSVVQKALMDTSKIKQLGWEARYDIKSGMGRTIQILQEA